MYPIRAKSDPVTFESDLQRLRRFYEARGYYHAVIEHDLTVDDNALSVKAEIIIDERLPLMVTAIDVNIAGAIPESEQRALPENLPLKRGDVFQEEKYQLAEQILREVFLRNGYAHVESQRKAEVNLDDRRVLIEYALDPGPPAFARREGAGQELQLVGTTEIIRGWAGFQGRRFEFTRGEIRFVGGGKIDPELDIVAQHRLPQYTVSAVVGGTAEKPSLTLRSELSLDQANILALLVFGKPTGDLSRGEKVSLKQSALGLTSGFAAPRGRMQGGG